MLRSSSIASCFVSPHVLLSIACGHVVLTGILSLVGVLLALVEAGLVLLLLNLSVAVGLLVTVLVEGSVADVGSRHFDVSLFGGKGEE
jgi:hypothetical protein